MPEKILAAGRSALGPAAIRQAVGRAPANFTTNAAARRRCTARHPDRRRCPWSGGPGAVQVAGLPTDTVRSTPPGRRGRSLSTLGPEASPDSPSTSIVAWDRIKADAAIDESRRLCRRRLLRQPGAAERAGAAGHPIARRGRPSDALAGVRRQSPAPVCRSRRDRGLPGTGEPAEVERPGTARLRRDVRPPGAREQMAGWLPASASRWWRSRGASTAASCGQTGAWSDHPGLAVQVCDTVGAGDAFTAALTVGLLAGWGLDGSTSEPTRSPPSSATKPGGMPALPDRLMHPAPLAPGGTARGHVPLARTRRYRSRRTFRGALSGHPPLQHDRRRPGRLALRFRYGGHLGDDRCPHGGLPAHGSFSLGFTVASALVGTILGSILVSRPADAWGRKRALARWPSSTSCRPWAARWPGTGTRSWPSGSWAAWRWAGLGGRRRCTSPRSPRPSFAAGWWPSCSSTSCSASCWRSCPTT